jgi:aspartate aminotransferase
MNVLSDRINNLAQSETIAMSQRSRELKAKGFDVINLGVGEPDFFTPDRIKEAAKKAIDENYSLYTAVNGYVDLRDAICEKLARDNELSYTSDQIVVCTGGKHAIMNTVLCLVNPGDEVIIPTPYWVSYAQMADLAEGKKVFIDTSIETDFKITPAQLESAITSKSKIFVFSNPCNPSGSVYSRDELKSLADVFEKHPNVFIISDEIYEHINFNKNHESIAQFENIKDRVILVNGVSKGFAMTGWRIGYLAAHKDIAQAVTKLQGQFTSGSCSIAQRATIEAMKMNPEETYHMLDKFLERRDLVLEMMREIPGVKTNVPQGAFYIFPDVSSYFGKSDGEKVIGNASDLCMYILTKAYVSMVAGDAFGSPNCIRLSYATSNELLIEAIKRFKKALSELK